MQINTFFWFLVSIIQLGDAMKVKSLGFRPSCASLSVQIYIRRQKLLVISCCGLWKLPKGRYVPVQSCQYHYALMLINCDVLLYNSIVVLKRMEILSLLWKKMADRAEVSLQA